MEGELWVNFPVGGTDYMAYLRADFIQAIMIDDKANIGEVMFGDGKQTFKTDTYSARKVMEALVNGVD